jgi:hypothetical protein
MASILSMKIVMSSSLAINGNFAGQLLVSELRQPGVGRVSTTVQIPCDKLSTPMESAVGNQKNGNCHQLASCADLIETKDSAVNARANGPEGFAND